MRVCSYVCVVLCVCVAVCVCVWRCVCGYVCVAVRLVLLYEILVILCGQFCCVVSVV